MRTWKKALSQPPLDGVHAAADDLLPSTLAFGKQCPLDRPDV